MSQLLFNLCYCNGSYSHFGSEYCFGVYQFLFILLFFFLVLFCYCPTSILVPAIACYYSSLCSRHFSSICFSFNNNFCLFKFTSLLLLILHFFTFFGSCLCCTCNYFVLFLSLLLFLYIWSFS